MYRVEILRSAARDLQDLPLSTRRRIGKRIDGLALEPRGGEAVKLRGSQDMWRTRVGDYRVLYRIENERRLVLVIKIGHRRDVYR